MREYQGVLISSPIPDIFDSPLLDEYEMLAALVKARTHGMACPGF